MDGAVPGQCRARGTAGRQQLWRQHPQDHDAGVCAQRSGARTRHHPGQYQPHRAGAHGHWSQLPGQDQRQHRQLGRHVQHRGRSRKTGLVHPLGRRHRDGFVHRQKHPHHARLDRAQLAGTHRHRADLPGAGEGGRCGRRPDLGDLPRHADRAGGAGRGLLHGACRRSSGLYPPYC